MKFDDCKHCLHRNTMMCKECEVGEYFEDCKESELEMEDSNFNKDERGRDVDG